jgi:hypothetical protein
MSLLGSVIVAAETVWSSGVGASVGLEAGYTQFASGIASRIGMAFRLRRADLRILVGCGAAGGIAGAFGAPLAGAFYSFLLWVRTFDTIEELRAALLEFARHYNETWLVARHGYRTPVQVRADQCRLDQNAMADLKLVA